MKRFIIIALSCVALCFAEPAVQNEKPMLSPVVGKLGVGMGVPYGIFGFNGEIGTQYVALLGGFGSSILVSEPGWSIGVRGYFVNASHKWRPHLSVVYGTTALYVISGAVEASDVLKGAGVYFGWDHDVGARNGFVLTYGIGFITHGEIPANVKNKVAAVGGSLPSFGSPLKVLFGVNYRFGGVKK